MRVTHVITRLIVGGAQENTIATVLGLRPLGVQTQLISGPTTGPEGSLEHLLAPYPGLGVVVPELIRPVHPWCDLIAFLKLTRIFQQNPPDIVHTHSGKAGVLGRLAAAWARVPHIVHTIHGPSFGPFQNQISNAVFRAAEQIAARVTQHFVVVANAMRDQYLAAGIGAPGQYTRIFSGFHLEPFLAAQNDCALRARYQIQPDDIVVGKIARLFPLKGHDDLFAAAPALLQNCPKLKFFLIGDGRCRPRFEALSRSLGIADRVVFAGLIPPAELPPLLGIVDLLVHLSRREGLPRALPQALAAGKPVIAFDCDGAREICLENETGFLVPAANVELFTQKVLLLARTPALRNRLGQTGRALVKEHFSIETMVQELYNLYRMLLKT